MRGINWHHAGSSWHHLDRQLVHRVRIFAYDPISFAYDSVFRHGWLILRSTELSWWEGDLYGGVTRITKRYMVTVYSTCMLPMIMWLWIISSIYFHLHAFTDSQGNITYSHLFNLEELNIQVPIFKSGRARRISQNNPILRCRFINFTHVQIESMDRTRWHIMKM